MATAALQKAMNGEKLPDTQVKGALNQAVDKITSLGKKTEKTKEAIETAGEAIVHSAEMQGSLFMSSLAEGYFGEEKMKPMGSPIDVRVAGAVVFLGYGAYEALNGKGGKHAIAIGNGIAGSYLATVARQAGQKLADKKGADAGTPPAPSIEAPKTEGARKVHLTPPRTAKDRQRQGNFRRASAR